jgi:hypothetical protein
VTAAEARQLRAALVSGCSLAGAEACAQSRTLPRCGRLRA